MKIFSPTARAVIYNGTHGNLASAHMFVNLDNVAADTQVVVGEIDTQVDVDDFRLDHAALGAGTSLDIGFVYTDGKPDEADKIAGGQSTAASGSKRMAKASVAPNGPCQVVITPRGAAVTGRVDLQLFYRNRG